MFRDRLSCLLKEKDYPACMSRFTDVSEGALRHKRLAKRPRAKLFALKSKTDTAKPLSRGSLTILSARASVSNQYLVTGCSTA